MSISKFFRLLFGITATGMIAACSVTGKMDRLEYFYNQDQRQRNLVMKVPAGYLQERIERLDNGIQVRSFEYPGGAKLYLACRDLASEPTVLLDAQPGADQRLFSRFGATGTGYKARRKALGPDLQCRIPDRLRFRISKRTADL